MSRGASGSVWCQGVHSPSSPPWSRSSSRQPQPKSVEPGAAERDRTRQAILDIVGGGELLATTPWFQRSIEARNPYIDPLNLIQIELLGRYRAAPEGEKPALRGAMSDTDRLELALALRLRLAGP
jgi:phosphoenolpyruvate carboxylase